MEGGSLILLYGFFSLGLSEIAIVIIAIMIFIGPKSITLIKPIVKSGYKLWLGYQREVQEAENEMDEVKDTLMEPILEAEREVENEMREVASETSLPLRRPATMKRMNGQQLPGRNRIEVKEDIREPVRETSAQQKPSSRDKIDVKEDIKKPVRKKHDKKKKLSAKKAKRKGGRIR